MINIIENTKIVIKNDIGEKEFDEISRLERICIESDNISFKLELDYKLKNIKNDKVGLIQLNEFMYYINDELIGYLGISEFGGDVLEVSGMVHPDYRNRGIFTQLYRLVQDEFIKRDNREMLLLCDNKSSSGISFIKKAGGEYHHSEYDMTLDNEAFPEFKQHALNIRLATKEDANIIAIMNKDFFDIDTEERDEAIIGNIENGTLFIAELDDISIGSVRIELNDGLGGIYGLGVLSKYRGKGYGRELIMWSAEKLMKIGADKVFLQVDTDNTNALNLYKSCGFKEDHVISYYSVRK